MPLGPAAGAAKVTAAPGTGLPKASVTSTRSGVPKVVPTVALWAAPAATTILAGLPGVFVRVNRAAGGMTGTRASTEHLPTTVLAVNVGAVATPWLSLRTVVSALKVPLGRVGGGAAKVTGVPGTGLPKASVTRACRSVP